MGQGRKPVTLAQVQAMYAPDMEAHLAKLDRNMPAMAASLRHTREQIAQRFKEGGYRVDEERQRGAEREQLAEQMRAQEVPQMIRQIILDGRDDFGQALRNTAAWERLTDSLERGRRLIILWGEPGTGKSVAACRWLSQEPKGLFVEASLLLSLSPNYSDDRSEIGRYERASRLVIDDLGRGPENPAHMARMEEILSRRYAAQLATICTTNRTARQIAASLGDRIASRMRELGGAVHFDEQLRSSGRETSEPTLFRRRADDTIPQIDEELGF